MRLTIDELHLLQGLLEQRINGMVAEAARSEQGAVRRERLMRIHRKLCNMERCL